MVAIDADVVVAAGHVVAIDAADFVGGVVAVGVVVVFVVVVVAP